MSPSGNVAMAIKNIPKEKDFCWKALDSLLINLNETGDDYIDNIMSTAPV